MWLAIVTMVLGSLVVAEVGRRSANGALPRNHLAGIRVPDTMRDDETWEVAHRAGGRTLVATGAASAVVALAAWPVSAAVGPAASAGVVLASAAVLIAGVLVAARQAITAAREHRH